MSCLSDVDLATLHRSKLNERVNYELSSCCRHRQNGIKRSQTNTNIKIATSSSSTSPLQTLSSSNSIDLNGSFSTIQSIFSNNVHSKCHNDTTSKGINYLFDQEIDSINADDDHFPILRRRRSGTWP